MIAIRNSSIATPSQKFIQVSAAILSNLYRCSSSGRQGTSMSSLFQQWGLAARGLGLAPSEMNKARRAIVFFDLNHVDYPLMVAAEMKLRTKHILNILRNESQFVRRGTLNDWTWDSDQQFSWNDVEDAMALESFEGEGGALTDGPQMAGGPITVDRANLPKELGLITEWVALRDDVDDDLALEMFEGEGGALAQGPQIGGSAVTLL